MQQAHTIDWFDFYQIEKGVNSRLKSVLGAIYAGDQYLTI